MKKLSYWDFSFRSNPKYINYVYINTALAGIIGFIFLRDIYFSGMLMVLMAILGYVKALKLTKELE